MDNDSANSLLLEVIVRFHDPSRSFELRRAIFALVCQSYTPIAITVVTQRFSAAEVEELHADFAPTLAIGGGSVKFKITNYSAAEPRDARSALLNLAIRESTGRYLAFLDHDDTILPDAYCELIRELASSDSTIAFGSIAMKDVDVFADSLLVERRRATFAGKNVIDLFAANFCPIHSFVIDREKVRMKDLWFDESLGMLEDYDFLLRFCATYPSSFRLIGKFVGDYYFKNDGSNTLPVESGMSVMSTPEFKRVERDVESRKQEYPISEAVQRMLGFYPASRQMTIATMLSHFAKREY